MTQNATHPESPPKSKDNTPLFYLSNINLPIVAKADKCVIWDTDGRSYIDACSGAIAVNMGHNHPAIKQAMQRQIDQVSFTYRTQFESQAAIDLADKLVSLAENKLHKVYFVGSGSEAVEAAMKLTIQYFYEIGERERTTFISLRPSYHGSTLGALGLTAYTPLEKPFNAVTINSLNVPGPNYYRKSEMTDAEHDAAIMTETWEIIRQFGVEKIAGFIIEPVGGASTGARVLSQRYVAAVRKLCDEIGALLIMDEVLTGVGRTGAWFAWQRVGVAPDIMALAKGLGAGYYPVGAIMAKSAITQPVIASGGFMHGHTYAGNPLACATGVAVIKALENENIIENVNRQGTRLMQGLLKLQQRFPNIGNVRGVGLLTAIEFVQDAASKEPFPADQNFFATITQAAKDVGLLVYPRRCLDGVKGDHILITPPLIVDDETVDLILARLALALAHALPAKSDL